MLGTDAPTQTCVERTKISSEETPGDDALYGVKEIAAFIGRSPRRTYHLLYEGRIPAGKEGVLWRASKKALRAHYDRLSGELPNDRSVH